MTIDEAIMIEKYYGKKDEKALKELQNNFPMIEGITDNNLHEQIVEWLEELKAIKSDGFTDNLLDMGYTKGYRKAVDDFVEKLEKHQQENWIDNLEYGITFSDIEQIAEQLKEGGTNG